MAEREDAIASLLAQKRPFPRSEDFRGQTRLKNMDEYEAICSGSEDDVEEFWAGLLLCCGVRMCKQMPMAL